jgi:hypothetical protein
MNRVAACFLLMLGVLPGPGTFAADLAGSAELPVAMDGRFSGFDAIAHIQNRHPRLAPWAESVSHWAGYYSVNPLLLAQVLETPAGRPLTNDVIRNAARGLAALPGRRSPAQLASAVGSAYGLSADTASKPPARNPPGPGS